MLGTREELRAYQLGFDDAIKESEMEMYQDFIATLSDIKAGTLDIDHAIKEMSNELAKRM